MFSNDECVNTTLSLILGIFFLVNIAMLVSWIRKRNLNLRNKFRNAKLEKSAAVLTSEEREIDRDSKLSNDKMRKSSKNGKAKIGSCEVVDIILPERTSCRELPKTINMRSKTKWFAKKLEPSSDDKSRPWWRRSVRDNRPNTELTKPELPKSIPSIANQTTYSSTKIKQTETLQPVEEKKVYLDEGINLKTSGYQADDEMSTFKNITASKLPLILHQIEEHTSNAVSSHRTPPNVNSNEYKKRLIMEKIAQIQRETQNSSSKGFQTRVEISSSDGESDSGESDETPPLCHLINLNIPRFVYLNRSDPVYNQEDDFEKTYFEPITKAVVENPSSKEKEMIAEINRDENVISDVETRTNPQETNINGDQKNNKQNPNVELQNPQETTANAVQNENKQNPTINKDSIDEISSETTLDKLPNQSVEIREVPKENITDIDDLKRMEKLEIDSMTSLTEGIQERNASIHNNHNIQKNDAYSYHSLNTKATVPPKFKIRGTEPVSYASSPLHYRPQITKELANVNYVQMKTTSVILTSGGINLTQPTNYDLSRLILRFQPRKNEWQFYGLLPEPRIHHGMVHMDGKVFLIGGKNPSKMSGDTMAVSKKVYCLDITDNSWTKKSDMTEARACFGIDIVNDKIYVVGGIDGNGKLLRTAECYDPNSDSWKLIRSIPYPCKNMAMVAHRNSIFIMGGMTTTLETTNALETVGINEIVPFVMKYEVKENLWFTRKPLNQPRACSAAQVVDGCILLCGGCELVGNDQEVQSCYSVDAYDDLTDKWECKMMLNHPRYSAASVTTGSCLFLFGGINTFAKDVDTQMEIIIGKIPKNKYHLELANACNPSPFPVPLTGMQAACIPMEKLNYRNEFDSFVKRYYEIKLLN